MLNDTERQKIRKEWKLEETQNPRIRMIKCSKKGCKKCPHGPYLYIRERKNNKYIDKYIGKCNLDGSPRE